MKRLHRSILQEEGLHLGPASGANILGDGDGVSQGPGHLPEQRQTSPLVTEQMRGLLQDVTGASGGQEQHSAKAARCSEPKEEDSRDGRVQNEASTTAERGHGLVTLHDTRRQPAGRVLGPARSSLPSPMDPQDDDSIEVWDAVIGPRPGAAGSPADGRVSVSKEDHAIPGESGGNSSEER